LNMRHRLSVYIIFLSIFLSQFANITNAQEPGGLDGFSIKASGGLLSFWGEVADAGIAPLFDSRFGFSLSGIKMFNPWFGIQAQYLQGSTFGIRNDISQYFRGSVTDFSLSARVEPLDLIESINLGKITPYATLGLATISYRSARRVLGTNLVYQPVFGYKTDGVTVAPKENGLAIPISLGIAYQVTPKFAIEVEHTQRITNQDVIDALPGTSSFNDMYALTSIGIKYSLGSGTRSTKIPSERRSSSKSKTETGTSTPRKGKHTTTEQKKINEDPFINTIQETAVFIERTLPETVQSGKTFEVKLHINKGSYKGRANLTQKFPSGFTAVEAQPGVGQFEFVNQTAIINWDQMPSDSIVTYKYHVRTGENLAGSITIPGKFEYDQAQGIKSYRFNDYMFVENKMESQMDRKYKELIGEEESNPSQKNTRNLNLNNKTDEELDTSIEELMRQYGLDQPMKKTSQGTGSHKVVSSKAVTGLEFRVQCGAFRNKAEGGSKLARKYGITETLKEEYHNGWYKYTVGSFKSYADAVRFRDNFINRTKIWSSFIVGYQNGTRLRSINKYIR
ncbi:MAG: SPOR domain-containing protein, partial [Bacteroidales bacterium]|nr:SPOR domain-containing protein [Bacteroidales bacterium]